MMPPTFRPSLMNSNGIRERGGGRGLDSLPTDFDQNATVRVEPDADTDSEVGAVVCVCVCV